MENSYTPIKFFFSEKILSSKNIMVESLSFGTKKNLLFLHLLHSSLLNNLRNMFWTLNDSLKIVIVQIWRQLVSVLLIGKNNPLSSCKWYYVIIFNFSQICIKETTHFRVLINSSAYIFSLDIWYLNVIFWSGFSFLSIFSLRSLSSIF